MCEKGDGTDSPAAPNEIPPQGPADFNCNGAPADEIELDGGNGVHTVSSTSTVADSGVLIPPSFGRQFNVSRSVYKQAYRITFTGTPGVYHYVCQIHDGMEGDITIGS